MAKRGTAAKVENERKHMSQADVPSCSLDKAIKVPAAIGENYGYKPATPLQVAKVFNVSPTTGTFRMFAGAAIAYGLTTGGYNAETISITPLGLRIVRCTSEGDDMAAKREALLKPRVIREFLEKYNGASIPKDNIAHHVLQDMGVLPDRTTNVLKLILEGAESVGFVHTIKDRKYIELGNSQATLQVLEREHEGSLDEAIRTEASLPAPIPINKTTSSPLPVEIKVTDSRTRRVFITHGKNKTFIDPIRELLKFGELEAVIAEETQTVSQPVPEKVMADMRSCGAAIIHVEDERHMLDKEAKEHVILNENVLIEIGAAMALYGQRFILVVKEGVQLPSNLQGLFQVRYSGENLDGTATIKLMKAINDMKSRKLP